MQIEEKLNGFEEFVLHVANEERESILAEGRAECEKQLEIFRNNRQIELENQFHMEETKIRRRINRRVSEENLKQKRILDECQRKNREELFEEVNRLLAEYQKTEQYNTYLIGKINMAKEYARGEQITIYINPSDKEKKEALESATGVELTVSEIDFTGGIRAVIRSRNILIDESFSTKLEQERNGYTF